MCFCVDFCLKPICNDYKANLIIYDENDRFFENCTQVICKNGKNFVILQCKNKTLVLIIKTLNIMTHSIKNIENVTMNVAEFVNYITALKGCHFAFIIANVPQK